MDCDCEDEEMEARLDGVLAVGRALSAGRAASEGFLLSSARTCLLNGDLVSAGGDVAAAAAASTSSSAAAAAAAAAAATAASASATVVAAAGEGPETEEGDGVEELELEDELSQSAGRASVSEVGSECATGGASVGTRDDEAASVLAELLVDDTAARKRHYLSLAGCNDERSTECLLLHLSGGYVVSSSMERVAAAFCSDGLWPSALVLARKASTGAEWLLSGFAVGTSESGQRTTLWRGKRIAPDYDASCGLEWFSLGAIDEGISVCLKAPDTWAHRVFYGQFPDLAAAQAEGLEDGDEDDYDDSPQYVLSVPGNAKIRTLICFELLHGINFIEGTRLDVYAVPGEEYEASDDPRAFWVDAFLHASCSPAGSQSSVTGLQLDLDSEQIYMLVPSCSQPLQYCIRVASEYAVEIFDLAGDSDATDDSEVGSLY